jgi:hypothetical protein
MMQNIEDFKYESIAIYNQAWARLNHLIYEVKDTPQNESIEDSFVDLLNYSAIALMVLRGKWSGVPSQQD